MSVTAAHQPGSSAQVGMVLVVAMAENRVIGAANAVPWRLRSDLQHFRAITWGKPIVMGRKTFTSLRGPLPGRTNIVLTRNRAFSARGVVVAGEGGKLVRGASFYAIAIVQAGTVIAIAVLGTLHHPVLVALAILSGAAGMTRSARSRRRPSRRRTGSKGSIFPQARRDRPRRA